LRPQTLAPDFNEQPLQEVAAVSYECPLALAFMRVRTA